MSERVQAEKERRAGSGETPRCATCGLAAALCRACGAGMPADFRFCGQCGASLENGCPQCARALPAGLAFCGYCGVRLPRVTPGTPPLALPRSEPLLPQEAPGAEEAAPGPPRAADEQLRRVAILFADLVGSTALGERLEAEQAYRVVSECLAGLGDVVTAAGGYVVKTLGDGLMALFGAPVAHGDDPERAARAALRMQEWMGDYAARVEQECGVLLRVRVGVNFGSVVAAALSAGGRPEYDVLGDAVNVAQRLESASEPGTVCVSESFYRLTRGEFEYHYRGVARVKGKSEPLALYQLVRPRSKDAAGTRMLPLVGRERVLGTLRRAARELADGRGRLLVLTGAAGLGKSRLLDELGGELAALGVPVLQGNGADAEREGPLALWRGWLADLLPIHPGMDHPQAAECLRATLRNPEHASWAEWLAALVVDPQRLQTLEPEDRDRIIRGSLEVFLEHWQQGNPGAILVDDVDLVDSASMSLLAAAGREGQAPLLVAVTSRAAPESLPAGPQPIVLRPLSTAAVHKLIGAVYGPGELGAATVATVVERAGGNPLFLTLMLQAARGSETPDKTLAAVPDSLYGLIQAQIDRLTAGERQAGHAAAVLGHSFAEHWLASLCPRLQRTGPGGEAWQSLERRGVLEEERPAPDRQLAFRHGVWQEVLYEGMLRPQRRELHERAAALFSTEAATRADLAARAAWHWRCAERWDEALSWTLKAAEHASALYAGDEAQATYQECLELAERLGRPASAAQAEAGLAELAEHQGEFTVAIEHFSRAETRLAEAGTESRDADPDVRALRCRIKVGHARVQARTGALNAARPLLEDVLELLDGVADAASRRIFLQALTERAHVLRDLGLLQEAEWSARRALKLADDAHWNQEAAQAASALGQIHLLLGDWRAADTVLRRAARLAEAGGNWREAAGCWINLSSGLQSAGRLGEAAAALTHALEQARRIGDAEKLAIVRMNLGTVHLNRGDWAAAEESFRGALADFQAMAHPLGVAYSLCNLAETLRWAGRLPEARELLRTAESEVTRVDAAQLRPHLLLTGAELLISAGDPDRAASQACEALSTAEELGYEAGASLARLTLGRALLARRDYAAAESHLQAAARAFQQMDQPLEEARARGELAVLHHALGQATEAHHAHASAVDLLERLEAQPWLAHLPSVGA